VEVGGEQGFLSTTVPDVEHNRGGTAVVDDFDLDGDLDFIVGFKDADVTLYRQDAGVWTAEDMGLPPGSGNNTIALVDIDGDGRRDMVFPGPPTLVVMNTAAGLVEREEMSLFGSPYVEFVPGDFNGDGHQDLFGVVSSAGRPGDPSLHDILLLNDGTGSFERTSLDGDTTTRMGFDGVALDWEGDGDLDIWVVNDKGDLFGGNALWRAQDGVLSDATEACDCGIVQSGMGADVGDYNNDGLPDLYGSATAVNALLEGQPDHTFIDVTLVTGASPLTGVGTMSWGAIFLDHDNDGREDLLVAEGDFWTHDNPYGVRAEMPLDLLRQVPGADGRPSFEDVSGVLGEDRMGTWRAVIARDFNGDGLLDILATDLIERPRLYLSEGCTAAGWIEVTAPVGSQVDICADGLRQTRWVSTESSWGGAGSPTVHLGLGSASTVDRLQVRLPTGEVWVMEDLEGRRTLSVD
jgi:hypothetical protein